MAYFTKWSLCVVQIYQKVKDVHLHFCVQEAFPRKTGKFIVSLKRNLGEAEVHFVFYCSLYDNSVLLTSAHLPQFLMAEHKRDKVSCWHVLCFIFKSFSGIVV